MKKNGIVKFGLLIVGFIFFVNPNISIVDILPDCIGCLFIIAALFKLGDLSAEVAEARRAFTTLFWIDLSKLPVVVFIMWLTGVSVDQQTIWLVFSFCYAVAEIVYGMRAFSLLFDGFAYIGARRDGGAFIFAKPIRPERKNKKGKVISARYRRLESVSRLTSVFIVVKGALCTLPDFSYLSSHDSLGYVTVEGMTIDSFRPMLIVIAAVVSLIFGIVWLCRIWGYTDYLSKNKAFWADMLVEYKETVAIKKGIFAMRRTHIFTLLASAAALFSVDFYLDEINFIPDFVSAILFFAAASVIANQIGGAKCLKLTSAAYFATSAVTYICMLRFTNEYVYSSVHKIERAKELYLPYAVSNAVSQIAFVAVVFALAAVVLRIVRAHTGINTITGVSSSSKPLEKVYAARAVRLRIFGILSAIMSTLYFYFVVDVKSVALRDGAYSDGGYLYFPRFEIAWMVDFAIAMIFAIFACNLLSDLLSEVRYKYKYE